MVHLSLVVPAEDAAFFKEMARLVRERGQQDTAPAPRKRAARNGLTAAQMQLAERWAARSGYKLRLSRPGLSFSDVLARNIAHEITMTGWPVGANLGTEQELMARYEVGRRVMREAIRQLKAQTIVVMRRGRAGGLIVAEPSLESGSVPAGIVLSARRLTAEQIATTRRVLELHILERCFARMGEETQELLKEHLLFESALDESATGQDLQQFHRLLAEITGDPSLELFLDILLRMTRFQSRYYRASRAERLRVIDEVRQAHTNIARALMSDNRRRGFDVLNGYLDRLARWL